MPENTDELLSAQPNPDTVADTSPQVTPQDFDFAAFLDGVRPTRRSVRLFPHAHLVARMEELFDEIESAPKDANVDHLIDAFDQAKADFHNGVWFTLEKRSSEWIDDFRKNIKSRLKLKIDQDDTDPKDVMTAMLHQLAEQIVVPENVTVEGLRSLFDTNEGELNKLLVAMEMANTSLAEKAAVIGVDFSQRRSTSRRQRPGSER